MSRVRLQVMVDESGAAAMAAEAEERDVPLSQVIREVLRAGLALRAGPAKPGRSWSEVKEARPVLVRDLADEWAAASVAPVPSFDPDVEGIA